MLKTRQLFIFFVLIPPAIAFLILPSIGLLDVKGAELGTYFYFAAFYLPALAIFMSGFTDSGGHESAELEKRWVFWLLVALSLLYVATASFDIIVNMRVLSYGISGAWLRTAEEGPRNSGLGAIQLLLSGAPSVLLALSLADHGKQDRRLGMIVALILFGCGLLCMLALSSRNSAAMSTVFITAVWLTSARAKIPTKFKIGALVSIFLLLAFFLYLFVERAVSVHGSIDGALAYFFANYDVKPRTAIPESHAGKMVYFMAIQLEFYLTHSVASISQYLSRSCIGGYGAYSYYGFFRIIDFIFRTNFVQHASDSLLHPGFYLSMPGTLFLDFCYGGVVVGWILIAVTALILYHSRRSYPNLVFLAGILLTMFAFSPFYPIGSSGNGFSLILISVATSIVSPLKRRLTHGRQF